MKTVLGAVICAAAFSAGLWRLHGKAVKNNVGQQLPALNLSFIGRDPTAELAGHLGITVIPHTIILDRPGRITWEGHPETVQPGDFRGVLN